MGHFQLGAIIHQRASPHPHLGSLLLARWKVCISMKKVRN